MCRDVPVMSAEHVKQSSEAVVCEHQLLMIFIVDLSRDVLYFSFF